MADKDERPRHLRCATPPCEQLLEKALGKGLDSRGGLAKLHSRVIAIRHNACVWDLGRQEILQPVDFLARGDGTGPCALIVTVQTVECDNVDGVATTGRLVGKNKHAPATFVDRFGLVRAILHRV